MFERWIPLSDLLMSQYVFNNPQIFSWNSIRACMKGYIKTSKLFYKSFPVDIQQLTIITKDRIILKFIDTLSTALFKSNNSEVHFLANESICDSFSSFARESSLCLGCEMNNDLLLFCQKNYCKGRMHFLRKILRSSPPPPLLPFESLIRKNVFLHIGSFLACFFSNINPNLQGSLRLPDIWFGNDMMIAILS